MPTSSRSNTEVLTIISSNNAEKRSSPLLYIPQSMHKHERLIHHVSSNELTFARKSTASPCPCFLRSARLCTWSRTSSDKQQDEPANGRVCASSLAIMSRVVLPGFVIAHPSASVFVYLPVFHQREKNNPTHQHHSFPKHARLFGGNNRCFERTTPKIRGKVHQLLTVAAIPGSKTAVSMLDSDMVEHKCSKALTSRNDFSFF